MVLTQLLTVVLWTGLVFILLRTFALVAPAKCRALLDTLFPTGR